MFSKGRKYLLWAGPIAIICLALGFNQVEAQTQTPDPTPTGVPGWRPTLMADITYSEENYTCVYNPPLRYATVTPSPLWYMKCAHCLPENQPLIQMTPDPTPTPGGAFQGGEGDDDTNIWMISSYNDWEDVSTLDPVSVPLPEQNIQNYDNNLGYNYFSDIGFNLNGPNGVDYTNYTVWNYDIIKTACPSLYCSYDIYFRWKFRCYAEECNVNIYEADTGTFIEGWELTDNQASGRYIAGPTSLCTAIDEDVDIIVEVNIVNPDNGSSADFQMHDSESQFICGAYTRYAVFQWVQSPFSTTPEITYPCAMIVGEGEEEIDMYGFEYSGVEFGATSCVDIGPYENEILGIQIDIPWIAHLCAEEVSFGNISMFGVDINLNMWAVILAVAWVVRNLFIS